MDSKAHEIRRMAGPHQVRWILYPVRRAAPDRESGATAPPSIRSRSQEIGAGLPTGQLSGAIRRRAVALCVRCWWTATRAATPRLGASGTVTDRRVPAPPCILAPLRIGGVLEAASLQLVRAT